MPPVQQYIPYTVIFNNEAEFNFACGLTPSGKGPIYITPVDAAALFGVTYPGYPGPGGADLNTIGKAILNPWSGEIIPGSGVNYNDAVLTTFVPGQAGNPANVWPAGDGSNYTWSCILWLFTPQYGILTDYSIPQRRWISGNESAPSAEGGSGTISNSLCRDSSRVHGGIGFAIRGTSVGNTWNRYVDEYQTGLVTKTSWERFYVRFRRLPATVNTGFWRCHGFPSDACGIGLKFTTGGDVVAYGINAGSVETSLGTVWTPVLNTWYLVDIFLKYDSGVGTTGEFRLYLNHSGIFAYTDSGASNLNAGSKHLRTELGRWTGTDVEVEIDLDDWINAELPGDVNQNLLEWSHPYYPIDWFVGSHVRRHFAVSADLTDWTGHAGVLDQTINPIASLGLDGLTSIVSGADIQAITDVLEYSVQDSLAAILGPVAAIISTYSKNAGATDGDLNYAIAGGTPTRETINQTALEAWYSKMCAPDGQITPLQFYPFGISHAKSADANLDTTYCLSTTVEYIGVWGPEDEPELGLTISPKVALHNCRYANSPWGYMVSEPYCPAFVVGGTYTGNGTFQNISLPAPAHFLWIRPTAGGSGGIKFFGASIEAHFGAKDRVIPNFRIFSTYAGAVYFRVSGNSVDINQSGVTYQYIAFCDPGMRFNVCGVCYHGQTASAPKNNLVFDPAFLADGAFAQKDLVGSISSGVGLYFKGPGNSGDGATGLTGAGVINNFGNFEAGGFNSGSDLHTASGQTNFSLWRCSEPNCAGIMAQICTYTGNGSSPRTINITPASGRYPIFVMVAPVAGASSYYRDPSHAGSASSNVDTLAASSTAITAVGLDTITVGASLNSNGVVYNVFALPGSDLGMLNGVYYNTVCDAPGPWEDPEQIIGDIIVMGEGGLTIGGTPPLTLLKDASGLYTLIKDKTCDTLIDRQTGQTSLDVKIPDPLFKTGYIGG